MSQENTSFEQMIDLVEGRLNEVDAQRLQTLIATDPAASNVHEWITNFVSIAQQSTLQSPPAATRSALEDLLPARATLADGAQRVVNYLAQLIRDVPTGVAFAGARSTSVDAHRQLMFDIGEGADLSVQLEMKEDRILVSGQVLAAEPSWKVLLVSEHSSLELVADEFGEFSTHVGATSFLRLDLVSDSHTTSVDLTPFLDRGADQAGASTHSPTGGPHE
jgi:hypothetical protein